MYVKTAACTNSTQNPTAYVTSSSRFVRCASSEPSRVWFDWRVGRPTSAGSQVHNAPAHARFSTASAAKLAGQLTWVAIRPDTARPEKPPTTVPVTYAPVARPTRDGSQ